VFPLSREPKRGAAARALVVAVVRRRPVAN